MRPHSAVRFINAKAKNVFLALKDGDDASKNLYQWIYAAATALEQNAFAGTQIKKRLIPKEYRKYGLDNIWKYDLPEGWRLRYTIK